MLRDSLSLLFPRDLAKLKVEINAYRDDSKIWVIEKDIKNSGGNLCLHICGSLKHFIGAKLGKTGYIRNRDLEFSDKNIPKEKLIENIEETISVVKNTLEKMASQDFEKLYPQDENKNEMTTGFYLIHLYSHFNYHLGQINYHRRLLDV